MTEMFDVDDAQLNQIANLANQQLKLEADIAAAEEALKLLKDQLKQISTTDIPEALAECGLLEFKTRDGYKVSVNPFYSASIPKDKQDEAFKWLRDNGHGDLIKNTISVNFGRKEDAAAASFKARLTKEGTSYTDKVGVHPQTLRAFVREQVESGHNLPMDLLGIFIGQQTSIKEV